MADITITLTDEEIQAFNEMLNIQSGQTTAEILEPYLKTIASNHTLAKLDAELLSKTKEEKEAMLGE